MQLVLTGIHQRTTPVALRERLAFDQAGRMAALQALREHAHEALILSTCNRVEIAAWLDDYTDPQVIARFLSEWHDLEADALTPHVITRTGEAAVHHLFHLAAGLDSMVLGEAQIMWQIKEAAEVAASSGALGPHLRRLVDGALTTGKLVRTETGIARLNLSVVSVAVELARKASGGLCDLRVLVVGAGRMAELAIKHLHGEVGELTVASRSPARATALAHHFGVHSASIDQLAALVAANDVVVCCTSAPEPVIDVAMVEHAATRSTPLVLVDLAVPRDVEPQAGQVPNVRLFDVDAMQALCEANRCARAGEINAAERLVDGEVTKFMQWWSSQKVVPTIRALREHAETIRAAELERTLTQLRHLGPREQAAIGALSAAIINKLLHQPIASLKNPGDSDDLAGAVQRLFQL